MKFGMIGAGTLSRAIAGHVVKAGHEVIFSNRRGPETLTEVVDAFGPHASAGTVAEAGAADFVVLAVHWTSVREAVRSLPPRPGRIVIDATNQWASLSPRFVADKRPRPAAHGTSHAGGRRASDRLARHPGELRRLGVRPCDAQSFTTDRAGRPPLPVSAQEQPRLVHRRHSACATPPPADQGHEAAAVQEMASGLRRRSTGEAALTCPTPTRP
ncbi:NAD(P)-binding domain-containing protein [Streptomyces sp. NBC_01549]|uniref:NADPH-dependent F420 reductase n=1 Tax=unclassified Streptomyces TaxID=2593676 RepID=UPI00224DEE0B|nr:NAD(P)-binding domain-containing protein [Streptomyces sp. NBC_01549]MCX4597531.1 NAD(P)-binding domain-containing protein [Streptomyces sp. NBC_01549]